MVENVPVLADMLASGPGISRGRNKAPEFGELGRQCSHICGAEGNQIEEPLPQSCLTPLLRLSVRKDAVC